MINSTIQLKPLPLNGFVTDAAAKSWVITVLAASEQSNLKCQNWCVGTTVSTMGRKKAGGGGKMLWAMFWWVTLGPDIHMDVTLTCSTYRNMVANKVYPFMGKVFYNGIGLFTEC